MDQQIDFTEQCEQEHYPDNVSTEKVKNNSSHPNNSIIFKLLHNLKPKDDAKILEIGFDDTEHLAFLFQKANGINYYGTSVSDAQLQKVLSGKTLSTSEKWSQLSKVEADGRLGFDDDFFDCCFSANSLYFWSKPLQYFMEIYRVLKFGGKFEIAFVEKNFGADLPWTQVDFTFYEINQVKDFFHRSGFVDIEGKEITEEITDKNGREITSPFVMISGRK